MSGGYRCLRVSRNMELLCINFLLSFWKVGSRLEAISRVLSPHADVRAAGCNGLSVSDREGVLRVSAETALQGKGRGSMMEQIKNEKLWLRLSELLSDVALSNVVKETFFIALVCVSLFSEPVSLLVSSNKASLLNWFVLQISKPRNHKTTQQVPLKKKSISLSVGKKGKNNFQVTPKLKQKLEHCSRSPQLPLFPPSVCVRSSGF